MKATMILVLAVCVLGSVTGALAFLGTMKGVYLAQTGVFMILAVGTTVLLNDFT